jgi:hypothetical protein
LTFVENVDRRILGAFVCIDAITGSSIVPAVPVTAQAQWTVKPNRSGTYVVFGGPGFEPQTDDFSLSTVWPAAVQFEVSLQDPSLRYLPRRAQVSAPLPVPAIPPIPATPNVFVAEPVRLYPSPAAPYGPNWATIHASVIKTGSSPAQGLPWAILQVVEQGSNAVLATGVTAPNGEALLAVIGLTVTANTGSGGSVTVSTVDATVTAYFDPSNLTQPSDWIPNPDDILNNLTNAALVSSSQTVQLGSGMELAMSFSLNV